MERTPSVTQLNFHHLRYFWLVARDGNLTRTAHRLRVSQSALSAQIRTLEEQLGEPLFAREGRTLSLTEAGRIALAYADDIFAAGGQLVATLGGGRRRGDPLRVGAVATLSRNFQESVLTPIVDLPETRLLLVSGTFEALLDRLAAHELDLVLSNRAARGRESAVFRSQRLARQPVSLIGHPDHAQVSFPDGLSGVPLLLPTPDSEIRSGFDALCARHGVTVSVRAEVDDMALLRLLARDTDGVALLPSVVVRDELRVGALREHCVVPDLFESFYAITAERRFQHPLLAPLLDRSEAQILAASERATG